MPLIPPAAANNTFEKAIGFLNISLIQADGSEVKLPKGVALRASNRTEAAVNQAMLDNPDGELNVKVTYNPVVNEPLEINLFGTPAEVSDDTEEGEVDHQQV